MRELSGELRLAVGRIARRLRRLYVDSGEGLSFLELAVLHRLDANGPTSPGELAGDEGVTGAAVAAALTSLENQGLVSRSRAPSDGRRVIATVTAAGTRTLREREDASQDRMSEVIRGLTADERRRLGAALPVLERIATEL